MEINYKAEQDIQTYAFQAAAYWMMVACEIRIFNEAYRKEVKQNGNDRRTEST